MIAFARPEPDDCNFDGISIELVVPSECAECTTPGSIVVTIHGSLDGPIECDCCDAVKKAFNPYDYPEFRAACQRASWHGGTVELPEGVTMAEFKEWCERQRAESTHRPATRPDQAR